MKKLFEIAILAFMIVGFVACDSQSTNTVSDSQTKKEKNTAPERPTDADLMAFKVYHHMKYMETTAKQAGGTNILLHTQKLPTEGTDPVVSPALDHLYTKVVVDLTYGPVTVEFPNIEAGRYYSIHVTDQEHYTIYDEIHPVGKFTIVRKGENMQAPEGSTIIESPGDYPHLFIRIQVKTAEDLVNTLAIQEKITLTANGNKELIIHNPIKHTLETHDVYPQNKDLLASAINFSEEDYWRVNEYIGKVAPKFGVTGNVGMFGPIDSKEPNSNDPEYRAAAIVGHLGFPVHHAFYRPFFTNCNDEVLTGDRPEVFTFPYAPEGVELFWSITRYSALTRNTIPGKNNLFNAYNTRPDADGNITVTFSSKNPNDDTYWIPVNSGEPYYFIVRYYKPDVKNLPKKPCN